MTLNEIREWAKAINVAKIDEKKRHLGSCYKEMIITNIDTITSLTIKIEKYTADIHEHLTQLEKIGIILPTREKHPEVGKKAEEKFSPLLP